MVSTAYQGIPRRPPPRRMGCYRSLGAIRVPFAGLSGMPVPAWQVHPGELRQLVRASRPIAGLGGFALYGAHGFAGFGRLGDSATEATVAKAAPAVGTLVAGPIGAAAGEVISLVAGLFAKQYFDVASMNADEDKEVAAWQKYVGIQGHVAGRAYGLAVMGSIWNGAVHSGMFPLNNAPDSGGLCFHDGCGKYPGDARWVTATIQGCSQGDCFPNALPLYNNQRSGKPADTPDAIYFMDDIFLPLFESKAQIKWISAADGNPQVKQLLYDVADAYLAQNASGTTPYVEYPAAQAGTPTPGAVNAQGSTGAKTATPAPTPASTVATAAPATPAAPATVYLTPAAQAQLAADQAAAAAARAAATPANSSSSSAMPASGSSTAPAASSTAATVPYVSTATNLPSVEPTGTTGSTAPSTAYQPAAAAPAAATGLTMTDWLLILAGAGLVFAALRGN